MVSDEKKVIYYVVSCVSEFAYRYGLKQKHAFQFLDQYKAIEFLKENYEIEHTLSFDDTIEDLFRICRNNGGVL
ncbi:MAG: DUF3791 domain-containing protein [Lachnospiraceae bacterium]